MSERKIYIKGDGIFEVRNKYTLEVIEREVKSNLIVTAGLVELSKLLNGVDTTYFRAIAIGTGTTGAAIGNTTLETEVAREAATCTYEATAKAVLEKTFEFGTGDSYAITEAGIFNNSTSGGEMLDRFTFTAKNVDADTSLYVKITLTLAAA